MFFRQGRSSQAVNLERGSACVSVRALGCPGREHDLGEELERFQERTRVVSREKKLEEEM